MDMKILQKVIEDTKNEEVEDKNKKVNIVSTIGRLLLISDVKVIFRNKGTQPWIQGCRSIQKVGGHICMKSGEGHVPPCFPGSYVHACNVIVAMSLMFGK